MVALLVLVIMVLMVLIVIFKLQLERSLLREEEEEEEEEVEDMMVVVVAVVVVEIKTWVVAVEELAFKVKGIMEEMEVLQVLLQEEAAVVLVLLD